MVTRKNGGKPDRKQGQKRRTVLTPDTPYGECSERLTAFGGLLALVKLADLIGFEKIFQEHFARPERAPKLGHYRMVLGFLLLLFVGVQRLGHFVHVRTEAMVCGTLRVACLPAVSTFWRHLAALGLPPAASLLKVSAACRQRVWALCAYAPKRVVVNIDTTSLTVYGDIQGAQKAYNPKHRGKPTLRPVLCFLEETKEYLCGSQRRGATMSTRAVARQILQFRDLLPDCVESVHVKGDGEFISWNSIQACRRRGYTFTFGKGRNAPVFPEEGWYRRGGLEYNECRYQPFGWAEPFRFVASRERKKKQDGQLNLLKEDDYVVRCFVTDKTTRPHHVIADYDTRAGVEPLIGEAQREGLGRAVQALPVDPCVLPAGDARLQLLAVDEAAGGPFRPSRSGRRNRPAAKGHCHARPDAPYRPAPIALRGRQDPLPRQPRRGARLPARSPVRRPDGLPRLSGSKTGRTAGRRVTPGHKTSCTRVPGGRPLE